MFQGVLLLWFGLRDTIFGDVRPLINNLIWKGEFDRILLKPYPAIGIILSSGFNYYGAGSIIAGIAIIIFAIIKLNISIFIGHIFLFILFLIFGMVMYMAVSVIYCTIIVIVVFPGRVSEVITKLLRFAEFPIEIYSRFLRFVLITIIPFSIWVYFPTQALLGRLPLIAYLSLLFGLLFFGLSIIIWNNQLKKYRSAGG
jgi:ABC-2 type transport system permease protein